MSNTGKEISCREAVAVVQEYLDGALEDMSAAEVREHFERCSGCYPHLRYERSFREALARAAGGRCAPEEVRRRVLNLLAEAGDVADADGR